MSSSLVQLSSEGKVAIITMNDGSDSSKNCHNLAFAQQLLSALTEVEANLEFKSLIITSDDAKNWSQGIDVPWFLGLIQKQDFEPLQTFLYTMDKVYETLMRFPVPVIAAINGHTFGNGCVLAAACDFRMMRGDKGYLCFPEVDMGIPFLPGLVDVITKAIPQKSFYQMILTGQRYTAQNAKEFGAVELISEDRNTLKADSLAFANTFNKKRPILTDHKLKINQPIINAMHVKNAKAIKEKQFFLS